MVDNPRPTTTTVKKRDLLKRNARTEVPTTNQAPRKSKETKESKESKNT